MLTPASDCATVLHALQSHADADGVAVLRHQDIVGLTGIPLGRPSGSSTGWWPRA